MACPRCGCLLLSRSRTGIHQLVCTDCGHPMDVHLEQTSPPRERWRDQAALALLLAVGGCVVGLAFSSEGVDRPLPARSSQERAQPARFPGD